MRPFRAVCSVSICLAALGTAAPDAALTKAVIAHALKRGLILLSCGMHGNAVRIMVPLTASDAIIEEGMAIFEAALGDAIADELRHAAE